SPAYRLGGAAAEASRHATSRGHFRHATTSEEISRSAAARARRLRGLTLESPQEGESLREASERRALLRGDGAAARADLDVLHLGPSERGRPRLPEEAVEDGDDDLRGRWLRVPVASQRLQEIQPMDGELQDARLQELVELQHR